MSHTSQSFTGMAELFPDEIAVHYSAHCPADATLLSAEQAYTSGMAEKRRLEFLHGRYCARQAMQKLGVPIGPVHKREDRSPGWPSGIAGTITHTGTHAAAAVGHTEDFVALGMDIERADPLESGTMKLILRPEERANASGEHAKLLFSIKETIYKCIHPILLTYVDFQEMQVDLSGPPGSFRAIPQTDNFDPTLISGLEGRYRVDNDFVISSAWIRRPG